MLYVNYISIKLGENNKQTKTKLKQTKNTGTQGGGNDISKSWLEYSI